MQQPVELLHHIILVKVNKCQHHVDDQRCNPKEAKTVHFFTQPFMIIAVHQKCRNVPSNHLNDSHTCKFKNKQSLGNTNRLVVVEKALFNKTMWFWRQLRVTSLKLKENHVQDISKVDEDDQSADVQLAFEVARGSINSGEAEISYSQVVDGRTDNEDCCY